MRMIILYVERESLLERRCKSQETGSVLAAFYVVVVGFVVVSLVVCFVVVIDNIHDVSRHFLHTYEPTKYIVRVTNTFRYSDFLYNYH